MFFKIKIIYKEKLILLSILIILIFFSLKSILKTSRKKQEIKVALCTMGKNENLYIKEFIEYYIKLDINHIFIYDDDDPGEENISKVIGKAYENKVTVFDTKSLSINHLADAFNHCYKNNIKIFDWFIMVDMDEFVYIVNDTLKGYLTNKIFDKCDFIKLHWVLTTDNNLIHYDPRPLFERFKPPYIKSELVKSIIRGNISDLRYWVHSPNFSPKRNVTCTNEGKIIYYKNINFQSISPININKAYIIHFRYKSTEELVNKIKRGYRNWYKNEIKQYLFMLVKEYFIINNMTLEKYNFIEKELNLNLSEYKIKLNKK